MPGVEAPFLVAKEPALDQDGVRERVNLPTNLPVGRQLRL